MITYLAEEQEKSMQMEEDIADNTTEEVEENKEIDNTENVKETEEEV